MELWEEQFRAGASLMPLSGLCELRDAIRRNDTSGLIRGQTVAVVAGRGSAPTPFDEVVACCAIGYTFWKATPEDRAKSLERTILPKSLEAQILAGFTLTCNEIFHACGQSAQFVDWFDGNPLEVTLPALLPVVEDLIKQKEAEVSA